MDLTWAGEELRDSVELARRRLDAVIAACRPAQRPGSLDEQEQLSRVLLELVATIRTGDPTIVAEIAAILADSPWAPEGAFVSLARIEGPVASIEGGSAAVRREIARCGALPGVVVRRLAGDRDGAVVVALLANASNTLAEDLIDTLVDRAVREPALRSSLARRAELGPAQAGRLARSLSSRERTRLARRFGSALAASPPDEIDRADEIEWVRKVDDRGELRPSTLLWMLRRGWSGGLHEGLRRLGMASGEAFNAARPEASILRSIGLDRAAMAAFDSPAVPRSAAERETKC